MDAPAEFSGTTRFQVLRRLGAGGMGVVYEALDRDLGVRVALKTIRGRDPSALLYFKNEFRSLQDLHHPNLVTLHELIEEGGVWVFTMDLVDGVDFLSWVRRVGTPAALPTSTVRLREAPQALARADTLPLGRGGPAPAASATGGAAPDFDAERLRGALVQLGRGLLALHDAGKVHRDVKPSNVLVTPTGHVVVLDFGLVAEAARDVLAVDGKVMGTVSYMAPEQASPGAVGPAADWYAVGTVLYEALTGTVPYLGSDGQVLLEKQRRDALPPSCLAPGVPDDLDRLACELLRRDPAARPGGREILDRLAPRATGARGAARVAASSRLAGRDAELAALRRAFEEGRDGRAVTALVHGESGIGKTALLQAFVRSLEGEPGVLVLQGRCYERESVPFKAVDGLVDELSRHLAELPPDQAAARLPEDAPLLAEVFPVLRQVIAAPGPAGSDGGAQAAQRRRARLFAALRELFRRTAAARRLVLVVDDLQWADGDSLALFDALLRPPGAPPLLFLATARDASPAALLPGDVRVLPLAPLAAVATRALVEELLGQVAGAGALDPAAIAAESGGHPLFVDALVRYGVELGRPDAGSLVLEEALFARVARLEPALRLLVELCAIAGGPLPQGAVARAAGDRAGFATRVAALRAARLLRTAGARDGDAIEPLHDRVRAAVLERLDPAARRAGHERLARALEELPLPDPEALATHWEGAGQPRRAASFAERVAARAAEVLAFDRAARWYRRALELAPRAGDDERALRAALADALAAAGRGVDAAAEYLAAAAGATGEVELDRRRKAADQLLRAGRIEDGVEALRGVLAALGLTLPATPRAALRSFVAGRILLRLRGLRWRERAEAEAPAAELQRLDACLSAAMVLGLVDWMYGIDFQTRYARFALRAGEPRRVAVALGMEAAFGAATEAPGRRRARRLVDRAEALMKRVPARLEDVAGISFARATIDYHDGRHRSSLAHCEAAERLLLTQAAGRAWELEVVRWVAQSQRILLGELAALSRCAPDHLREAQERNDVYATTNVLTGSWFMHRLAADEPDLARREVEDALARWSRPSFDLMHFTGLYSLCSIELYAGRADAARERLLAARPTLGRSLLLRVPLFRIALEDLGGRVALARGAGEVRAVERAARWLAGRRLGFCVASAENLLAGAAAARGHAAEARRRLERAIAAFDEHELALSAAAARRRLGVLLGGDAGRALIAQADAWMTAQSVRRPERMAALQAPGCA